MTRKKRSFQKGYAFQRKGVRDRWVIRYRQLTADGKWRHRAETVLSPRRKDAETVLADRLRAVNGGQKLPAEIRFDEFAQTHWETYLEQNLKPSTRAAHRSNLKAHLLPTFGKMLLAEIAPAQVLAFLAQKREAGLSQKTLVNLYTLLQKILNLAVDLEFLQANPMRRVPKPRVMRAEKPTLTPAQVRAVVDATPEYMRALVVLLYLTGVRIGEALGLKWADMDFDRGKLYIRRSVWKGGEQEPKSRRSIRAKHLPPRLAQALKRHRELSFYTALEDYVFANGAGCSYDPDDLRKRVLYPAMGKAGIARTAARAFGFHIFRHSAGSQMQEQTGDLKQTQSFLGHSGIAITGDTYIHLQPDSEIASVRKLEDALFAEPCSTVLRKGSEEGSEAVN
jgi:integrase